MSLIRTLFLYVTDESKPETPPEWSGMHRIIHDKVGHAVDEIAGNEIHVFDLSQLGYDGSRYNTLEELIAASVDLLNACLDDWGSRDAFDILVAGQTTLGEKGVRAVQARDVPPFITIRFSMYYGQGDAPYGGCSSPGMVYTHDCPKDYASLFTLLGFAPFIRAVKARDGRVVKQAALRVSPLLAKPLLTFFSPFEAPILFGGERS